MFLAVAVVVAVFIVVVVVWCQVQHIVACVTV